MADYDAFRRTVLKLTGIDLDCYKGTQLERRLAGFVRRAGLADLKAYVAVLEAAPSRVKEFQDFLTINVSEWFRNPEKFDELQGTILPEMLRSKRRLRLWSAGCSNGAEPYTLAALLYELDPGGEHEIIATDLDIEILKVAAAGEYTERDLKNVSPDRLARHFATDGDRFIVKPHLRQPIRFQRHNLLADSFPVNLDMVVCRNVVIYFTEPVKERLYQQFHQVLVPGGLLFVGGTESLLRAWELGFEAISPFFYRTVT